MRPLSACLLFFVLPSPLPAEPLDADPEDLRPGLRVEWRSRGKESVSYQRIDAKPAFNLGFSSPHPRIPAGAITAEWHGVILLREPSPIRFYAYVGGEVEVDLDGINVLRGQGTRENTRLAPGTALTRKPGLYRIAIRFRSLDQVPARLQLGWEGPSFAPEPIPAWRFYHLESEITAEGKKEVPVARGKALAQDLGCMRCHQSAFPGLAEPPPGPSLHDVPGRLDRAWLMAWLADPHQVQEGARMPRLFAADRTGLAERWLVADALLGTSKPASGAPTGNDRQGRREFLSVGCIACHFIPEEKTSAQPDLGRRALRGLGDRFTGETLAAYLLQPHGRYPDGRMPPLPLSRTQAGDIAAYLLLWNPRQERKISEPSPAELEAVRKRLNARTLLAAGEFLLREKGCVQCHPGLGPSQPRSIPVRAGTGCLGNETLPRFNLSEAERGSLADFVKVAGEERHASPFAARQRQLERAGCVKCHPRDTDKPSPLETASSLLGGAFLQYVPFLKTPKLTYPHQKFTAEHLARTVREGISGLRGDRFSFRMPAFGTHADTLVQALAEADGERLIEPDPPPRPPLDPTAGSLAGPLLVGFQGYSCISCHLWKGQKFGDPDPGALATDLVRVPGRIRREWFDRFLEDPARFHPGTPMPAIFTRGKPALLPGILDGEPARQKDALWHYFALAAPDPKPAPPLAVAVPGTGPLLAQVPVHLPDHSLVESLTLLNSQDDLLVYDLQKGAITHAWVGGRILRSVQARLRKYTLEGSEVPLPVAAAPPLQLVGDSLPERPTQRTFLGYDFLPDGARLRWRLTFPSRSLELQESFRIDSSRRLVVEVRPAEKLVGQQLHLNLFGKSARGADSVTLTLDLPAARKAAPLEKSLLLDPGVIEGSLERPGYQATAYPRPKTVTGEDAIVPVAVAVHPRDGRVFIASMKLGEIFVLNDPFAKQPKFEDYAKGLFQEAYALWAEEKGLHVLHRRNLSRIVERQGAAAGVERVLALPHGIGDTYDYAYGLVRDRSGAFVYTFAPHANKELPGSGSVLRHRPGETPEEIAFGMRNPVGWCLGPDDEIFFTDNQGEWVATNKLCHVVKDRFFGYPNQVQKEHAQKSPGKTTIWVPYGWARSINGAAYDNTGGKFGPFAGQIFMAELMYGGAIVRANLEKINGVYQGACFPFWGKGLLGPVSLAFDPKRGPLYVAGITEPGWMAQPDRGALFRIDFTGIVPFEMQSLHVRPQGFRILFTQPVDPAAAADPRSYHLEHYRYEFTGSYGSPELDRTAVNVEQVKVAQDGKSVDLVTGPLVKDRVYLIQAAGVRSREGKPLVHPTGAYTLNEIPR